LKVDRLLVGTAVYESTVEGDTTPTRSYIWGKNAVLLYVPPSPGLMVASCGYTFVWRQTDSGGYTIAIRNTRQDDRDRDLLKGKQSFDHKLTGTDLGYMMLTAVS